MTQIEQINSEEYIHKEMSAKIIRCFYNVYNALGYGFLENVYLNALKFDLENVGFVVEKQKPIKVYYQDKLVGEYFADLVVENTIILELKSAEKLCKEHEAQLLNYLKATKYELGLLLNFGKSAEIKRKIYSKRLHSDKF